MNTNQIRYLIEISNSPSISIASQNLHISTPALSIAIKKLEEELGFPLLNRSFKGISLTEAGQEFVHLSTAYLDDLNQLQQKYRPKVFSGNRSGQLYIPVNYYGFGNSILGEFVVYLSQNSPDFHVTLEEVTKKAIVKMLKASEIEFGFVFRTKVNGHYVDELDPDLLFAPIIDGSMKLITSPENELSHFQSITMKKAAQYPLCTFMVPNAEKDSTHGVDFFVRDQLRLPIQFEIIRNYSLYREKIRQGLANSLSVQLNTEETPTNYVDGCKVLNVRDDIKIYFGLLHRKDSSFSEDAGFFMREFEKYVARAQKSIR